MMKENKHLTKKKALGSFFFFDQIRQIKAGMNRGREKIKKKIKAVINHAPLARK